MHDEVGRCYWGWGGELIFRVRRVPPRKNQISLTELGYGWVGRTSEGGNVLDENDLALVVGELDLRAGCG